MCAKWVGDAFGGSIYEELSGLKSIPYLEHHPPHSTYTLTVVDVMESDVICINEVEKLSRIVEVCPFEFQYQLEVHCFFHDFDTKIMSLTTIMSLIIMSN